MKNKLKKDTTKKTKVTKNEEFAEDIKKLSKRAEPDLYNMVCTKCPNKKECSHSTYPQRNRTHILKELQK